MNRVVCAAPTRDGRDRLYARIVTETDRAAETLSNVRFGTLARSCLELEPVAAVERDGVVPLGEVTGHYAETLREEFDERPLAAFVDELARRTPYDETEAEVVVTRGWFDLTAEDAVATINQHLREPYAETSVEEVERVTETARETRERIRNADEYPFGL